MNMPIVDARGLEPPEPFEHAMEALANLQAGEQFTRWIGGYYAGGYSVNPHWDADFKEAKTHIQDIVKKVLENPMPKGVVLNVNIPKLAKDQIKGIRVCKQADAKWEESFDQRVNPHGKTYFWLSGYFNNMDESPDADEVALSEGYISVVPVKFDLTAYEYMQDLKGILE